MLLLNILSPRCTFRRERWAVHLPVEVRRWDFWFILTLCHHAALLSGLSSLNCRAVFQVRDFSNSVASGSLLRTNEPSGPGDSLWHQSHTCPRRDDTRLHGLKPNEMHAGWNGVNKACLHVNSPQCRLVINKENRDVLHKNRSRLWKFILTWGQTHHHVDAFNKPNNQEITSWIAQSCCIRADMLLSSSPERGFVLYTLFLTT